MTDMKNGMYKHIRWTNSMEQSRSWEAGSY